MRPVHRSYPLLFLLLTTVSVAALFHGIDKTLDTLAFAQSNPTALIALGIVGLFFTGTLYKRLGGDKIE